MYPMGPKCRDQIQHDKLKEFVRELDLPEEPTYEWELLKASVKGDPFSLVVTKNYHDDKWTIWVTLPSEKDPRWVGKYSRNEFQDKETALKFARNILKNPNISLLLTWRRL